jgi:hypothetical protein
LPPVSSSPFAKYKIYCMPIDEDEYNELCLGSIGQGSKLCIKRGCTSFHNGTKATIPFGSLQVMHNTNHLFIEPSAPSSMIDPDLLDMWFQEKLSLEEWSDQFAIIRNTNTVATKKSFGIAQNFAKTAKTFKSPLKSPSNPTQLNVMLNNVFKTKIYKRKIESVEEFISKKPTLEDLTEILATTEESVEEITTGLVATNNGLETLNYKVENELPILFSKQESLEASIGTRVVGTKPLFEAPTLWNSVSLLSDLIVETRSDVVQLQLDASKSSKEMTSVALNAAKSMVIPKEIALQQRITDVREGLKNTISNMALRVNRDGKILFKTKNMLDHVQTNIHSSSNQSSVQPEDTSGLRAQMNQLETTLRAIEADSSKESVKFCKLGFKTLEDSAAWVESHKFNDFGLVVDIHFIFEHVYSKFNVSGVNQTAIIRLQQLAKINIKNLNLGLAISSFDTRAPRIFTLNESGPNSKNDESFLTRSQRTRLGICSTTVTGTEFLLKYDFLRIRIKMQSPIILYVHKVLQCTL